MRSVLTACLVTVGVVLMAADRAEALTVPAAADGRLPRHKRRAGPAAMAGGDQTPLQLWELVRGCSRQGRSFTRCRHWLHGWFYRM